ncbi:regulatory protein RecX [Alteromonas facilis]|uniref:regulatory protein RecX n=1 Tax=Alteromonas facilis TaxID=2048004 RepID=UPI000C29599D|nr:regulatory protein RecX [Alteromonas facilis]
MHNANMEEKQQIYHSLIRLLARREHSRTELIRKLQANGFDRNKVDDVLSDIQQQGLQSDSRYIEMMVRSAALKGHGEMRLMQQLQQNGISRAEVQTCLENADIDWWALALQAKQKKFGELPEQDFKLKQKQQRFLAGRGFTLEQINYAIHFNPESDA